MQKIEKSTTTVHRYFDPGILGLFNAAVFILVGGSPLSWVIRSIYSVDVPMGIHECVQPCRFL